MNSHDLVKQKQAVLYERREAHSRRKRILFFIIFIILLVSFFYLIRKPFLRVHNVNVSSSGLVDSNEVQDFINLKISGYKYFVIPNDSLIFIKKEKLQDEILKSFPRLSTVETYIGHTLKVELKEPFFETMYCGLDIQSQVDSNCALLHLNGKAGSFAPQYSYSPLFTFFSGRTSPIVLGEQIIDPSEIKRITDLRYEIDSYGMNTYGYVYGADYDEILLDAGYEFKDLPKIRLLPQATDKDIRLTLGVSLEDPVVKKLLLEKLDDLAYIDLRFDGQVVYKKKGEE